MDDQGNGQYYVHDSPVVTSVKDEDGRDRWFLKYSHFCKGDNFCMAYNWLVSSTPT